MAPLCGLAALRWASARGRTRHEWSIQYMLARVGERLLQRDAQGLLSDFAARRLSPVEVVDALAARIDAVDRSTGGFTALCLERAREEAGTCEAAWQRGEARPLEGVPFAVKDLFDSAGVRTAYGSPMFGEHVPT